MAGDWLLLSRVPFLSAGILPFILGSVMARAIAGVFNLPVFLLGLFAILFILLATNYNGEVHDIAEDRLSAEAGSNPFAGGSQVLLKNRVKPRVVENVAYSVAACALGIGIILQFFYKTGPWTLPLGLSGAFAGFYYSKPPFRWVKRGIGELLVAYSYGWLPVAAGFYLQTQKFSGPVFFVSLPVALTIFNVILINEFLDHPADAGAGKTNLLVRIGKARGAMVYVLAALTAMGAFFCSLTRGAPFEAAAPYFLVVGITIVAVSMVMAKKYESRSRLQIICGMSIVINLLTVGSYVLGFLWV
jgi:1,4-dihydroxy-2-naphthoate octaprenyltransferase